MDDVDEPDEREELFYNNVREKIVRAYGVLASVIENVNFLPSFLDFSLAVRLAGDVQFRHCQPVQETGQLCCFRPRRRRLDGLQVQVNATGCVM